MRVRVLVIAGLFGVLAAHAAVAQRLTTPSPAWERSFTVSWEAFERRGQPQLRGYVVNRYGAPAAGIQLLVESLDASGRIVAQRVEWLGGGLGPFSRRYFEVPVPQPASSYRVSVYAFDFLQAARSAARDV